MLLLFFFLASSESLLRRFVEILPRFDDKRRAVSIVTEIEDSISQYLLTISMMNALVGLLNGVASPLARSSAVSTVRRLPGGVPSPA